MNRRKCLAVILGAIGAVALYDGSRIIASRAASLRPDAHQEIPRLAEAMQWKPGITVADIGAGDGTYTFAAEKIVGASGHVYATEIDAAKLTALRDEVAKRKLANVTVVESAADDTKLPSDCCDAIFMRRVYHHITTPEAFDENLLRSLKPGGRLAIIDFAPDKSLPPVEGVPANRGGHGIPQKIMVDELTAAGFQVEKTIEHWPGNGSGNGPGNGLGHDYCVIFVKPKA